MQHHNGRLAARQEESWLFLTVAPSVLSWDLLLYKNRRARTLGKNRRATCRRRFAPRALPKHMKTAFRLVGHLNAHTSTRRLDRTAGPRRLSSSRRYLGRGV